VVEETAWRSRELGNCLQLSGYSWRPATHPSPLSAFSVVSACSARIRVFAVGLDGSGAYGTSTDARTTKTGAAAVAPPQTQAGGGESEMNFTIGGRGKVPSDWGWNYLGTAKPGRDQIAVILINRAWFSL